MNIFFLDRDVRIAAQYHNNKHVVKMILESAQLLSTAHRVLDGTMSIQTSSTNRKTKNWKLNDQRETILYKVSHLNHPSAIWARSNIDHYRWLYDLFYSLIGEYKYRYEGKYHKCETLLIPLLNCPENIPIVDWQDPPQAMPDDCKTEDTVEAYRNYYRNHKRRMASWKIRSIPEWYK
jgi:hypothetical protein